MITGSKRKMSSMDGESPNGFIHCECPISSQCGDKRDTQTKRHCSVMSSSSSTPSSLSSSSSVPDRHLGIAPSVETAMMWEDVHQRTQDAPIQTQEPANDHQHLQFNNDKVSQQSLSTVAQGSFSQSIINHSAPSSPKKCYRCMAGEPGHIAHILS